MVNAMVSTVSLGTLLVAGTALAQSPGPSVGPGSADIVPVTGPSTVPSLPDPVRFEAIEAPAPAKGSRAGSVRRVPVESRPAAHGVKTVRKPAATATAKKASASKRVTKTTAGDPAKAKSVAAPKRAASARHAVVAKPVRLAKPRTPAKHTAPAQPVLPRV